MEDEVLLVAGKLYGNEVFLKRNRAIVLEKDRFSLENITNRVNEVRETQLSEEEVKYIIKRAWKTIRAMMKESLVNDKDNLYSVIGISFFSDIPKECLEMIIGEKLSDI